MQAERDYLQNIVFPELAERLRARHHHLEPIDLRWGVRTVAVDDEHEKELLILTVCLDEVERSRPFFIGLLGDRYGWVPPEARLRTAAEERGFQLDVSGKSVTALEIEFGVLGNPTQKRQCFFYLRDPLPYDHMERETAALFSESHSTEPGAERAMQRLVRLKERLKQEFPDRVRHYAAKWNEEEQRVTGLEDFGRLVLEDLWAELEVQTRECATLRDVGVSTAAQERCALDDFVEERKQEFVGRGELLGELEAFAASSPSRDPNWGICLTGPDGCGKSAVFAQLCLRLQQRDAVLLACSAEISARSSSVDSLLGRWNEELLSHLGLADPLPENTSIEKTESLFAFLLGNAAEKKRVILLVDAVDKFEDTARARYLSWLPEAIPKNVRLIATTAPADEPEVLTRRVGVISRAMPPLQRWEAEAIVHRICERYHRQPALDMVEALLGRQADDLPCWMDVAWLHLASHRLNLLDAADYSRAETEFWGPADARLHALLLDMATHLPADSAGMYDWILKRGEKLFGESWTKTVALLIALTPNGWLESDLKALLPAISTETWDDLRFAGLRRSFLGHLRQNGSQGQWAFLERSLCKAVLQRYATEKEAIRIHGAIADYLLTLPAGEVARRSETMYHLLKTGDSLRIAMYYASSLPDAEFLAATWSMVDFLAAAEFAGDEEATKWIVSLPETEGIEDTLRKSLAIQYSSHLRGALMRSGVHEDTRMALMQAANRTLKEFDKDGSSWRALGERIARTGSLLKAGAHSPKANLAAQKALGVPGAKSVSLVDRLREAMERWQQLLESGKAGSDRYNAEEKACEDELGRAERLVKEGRNEDAICGYENCRARALELVERNPDKSAAYDWVYLCCVALTRLHMLANALDSAIEDLRTEAELAIRAAGRLPKEPSWLLRASDSHRKIASLLMTKAEYAASVEENRRSLDIIGVLCRLHPATGDWRQEVSIGHSMLAEALAKAGNNAGSITEYVEAIKVLRSWVDSESCTPRIRYHLFLNYLALGHRLCDADDASAAADSYTSALPQAKWLVDNEPENPKWHFEHAVGHYTLGAHYTQCSNAAGLPHLQFARDILKRFEKRGVALDPKHKELAAAIEQVLRTTGLNDDELATILKKSGLENIA